MNIGKLQSDELRMVANWEDPFPFNSFDTNNWVLKQFGGTVTSSSIQSVPSTKFTTTGSGAFGTPQIGCVGFQSLFDLPAGDFEVEVKLQPLTSFSMHWNIPNVVSLDANGRPSYTAGRSIDFGQNQGMMMEKIAGNNQMRYVGSSIPQIPTVPSTVRLTQVNNRAVIKIDGKVDMSFTMNPLSNGGTKLFISNGSTNFFGFGNYSTVGNALDIININIRPT